MHRSIQRTFLCRIAELDELEEGDAELYSPGKEVDQDQDAEGKFHQALAAFTLVFHHSLFSNLAFVYCVYLTRMEWLQANGSRLIWITSSGFPLALS